ncbi:uncharacterized protein KY384_002403 [Bacidia gigantensis]|uniref:uncharacterized protein n=1 Tax=Bacidia gigantensis TaxID=2732470 RepID=UPI001D0489C9|nr:uncharacterized protein KY384_002403 [Bacidia gigantensis]KAG8532526.1 hypothetical protein KY384_002403 [Bacidia gigantensis]
MAARPPATHVILTDPYGGKGATIMAATWAQAAVALTFMLLRTYTNVFIVKSFKWDYFWAMLSFVCAMIAQAMITISCLSGLGNHTWLLWGPQLAKANLYAWIGQIICIHSIGFGKIAVIAFLLRIQSGTNSKSKTYLRYFLYFVAISNIILNINQTVLILLSCNPTAKLWDHSLPGSCGGEERHTHGGYFQGSWAAVSDVVLALYPVIVFWNLKISLRMKIGLCLLMAGGLVAAVGGVMKTINIKFIEAQDDKNYFIANLVIWAYTESWLIIILGCLPPLRPLFVTMFYRLHSTYKGSYKRSGYYNHTSDADNVPIQMYPASHTASAHKATNMFGDTESERKILPPATFNGDGILRTTQVHVHADRKEGQTSSDSDDDLPLATPGKAY